MAVTVLLCHHGFIEYVNIWMLDISLEEENLMSCPVAHGLTVLTPHKIGEAQQKTKAVNRTGGLINNTRKRSVNLYKSKP